MESSSSDGDGSSGGDHLQKKKRTEGETRPLMVDAALFECPVCCEPLIPPIFQCKNGHLACSSCCPYLSYKCPVCDLPVGHNRCFGLERLLESARVPCRNAKFGCIESLSYGKESNHENECSFSGSSVPNSRFVIPPLTPLGPNAPNGRGGFALRALHAPVLRICAPLQAPVNLLLLGIGVLVISETSAASSRKWVRERDERVESN